MNPETSLVILTTVADFLLKVTFASGIFWGASRLVTGPSRRFAVWLSFLVGAGAYWVWKWSAFLKHAETHTASNLVPAQGMSPVWNALEIPAAWSVPLNVAVCAIVCAYFLRLGYFFVSYIRKYIHLRWVLGFTWSPPEQIAKAFASLSEEFGVRNCKLLMLTGITSPATIGWVRPIVLLPELCCERDAAETEDILRHELHHVRRHDFFFGRIAGFFQALLFFHPVALYAKRQIELERELACDLAVVSDSPNRRIAYAECLISFARSNEAGQLHPWGVDFAAASSYLKVRIHRILHEPKEQPSWMLRLRSVTILLLLAVFFNLQPALTVFFAYARTEAPEPARPVSLALPSTAAKRSVAARKVLPAKTETVNRVSVSLTSPEESLVEIPLQEDELPKQVSQVRYDLLTLSDREADISSTAAPPTTAPAPQDPQRGGKQAHTKARNTVSFLVKVGIVASSIAEALEHGDRD